MTNGFINGGGDPAPVIPENGGSLPPPTVAPDTPGVPFVPGTVEMMPAYVPTGATGGDWASTWSPGNLDAAAALEASLLGGGGMFYPRRHPASTVIRFRRSLGGVIRG